MPVPQALRRMIIPAAVSQIIVLIYNMADTFYIGRTNNPYMLAGASLILPVFNLLLCLSALAGVGGGTVISRLLGSGDEGEARKVSAFSFWFGAALSLATGLVVAAVSITLYELFTPWIVRAFIADPETVALASTFLRIRILATPLMFLSFFTVYLFQGFGIGRVAMVLAILRWAVFNIPMLVLLNALVGMYGILWTPAIGDGITVLLSLAAYLRWRPRARTETPQ